MRRIQALPEGVRNSVRSGVVLYDLTRVVEELVLNSLDAGATKVSVAVGVGTCVVKVADNGSGIDRDGLALLGERFATSKHDHLADLDTTEGNFGFRGEALCSISDVSLLEIISKAHGMPHGYGKVLKSRKCLYLGINDDMHDVGTTVTVRDLFYNQPVRRKHMHSSSKKVLHLAKKCVLRIALVHPRVSFKVFNIESGEEVLGTCSSHSPLTLLSTNFGVDAASALSELKVSEGVLKLSGYISGPRGIMSVQDVQYIYINSRFVCKGPIHKLLNELAAVCMDGEIHNIRGQIEKPSRCLTCPAFLLNLSCPRSQYDMIFEPMKSSVEFTDWNAVLEFIQGAVTQFWRENISEDFPECCESKRKKSKTLRWSSPVAAPFSQPEKQTEDDICLPPLEKSFSSSELGNGGGCELPKHQKDVFLTGKDDCSSHSYNTSDFDCGEATNKMGYSEELVSGDLYSNTDNYMLNKVTTVDHGSQQEACFLDLKWQNRPFDMDDQMTLSSRSPLCANYHQFSDGAVASQVSTRLCQVYNLKGMSLQDIGQSFTGEVGVRFNNADFDIQKRCSDFGENFDLENRILEESDRRYDIVKPPWLSKCTSRHDKMLKTKSLLLDVTPSIVSGDWANENYLASQSVTHDNTSGCNRLSSTSEWSPRIPSSMYGQDLNTDFVDEDLYLGYGNGTDYNYCQDREGKYCNFNSDPAADCPNVGYSTELPPDGNGTDHNYCQDREGRYCNLNSDPAADCPNVGYSTELLPNGKHNASLPRYFNEVKGHKRNSPLTNCSNILTDEVNWLSTNTSGKSNILNSSNTLICKSEFTQSDRNQFGRNQTENRQAQCQKREVRRSFSAPPFCKRPRKSLDLRNLSTIVAEKIDSDGTTSADMSNVKQELPALDEAHSHSPPKDSLAADFLCDPRLKNEVLQKKDFISDDIQDLSTYDLKWRKNCQHAMGVMESQNVGEDEILDISSDMLAYSCDSLVPTSISKTCLRDAKVLQQVDKKFIPVVAGNILAIIDQHAADERIRLEELRKKVLSGEMKQITYLEAEKELVLPEMGYQLLQNYGEQVQSWGWICDINSPDTRSFAKKMNVLHRQHNVAKLVAVPCILGVNLTDTDLLEFLQQLADTDGSSAVPPSVLRILNNKACRGAIMFGDTLLPSECSLIVEELKQTSLCFQCAHGRPTTVPLVNLGILHSQIDRFALRRDGTLKWQGLRRHAISFERAASRLSSAME